jgi:GTPase SAR1 family protein
MKNFFFDKVNIKPKKIKILIMGLPGSGKTTLARKLKENLYCDWFYLLYIFSNLKAKN